LARTSLDHSKIVLGAILSSPPESSDRLTRLDNAVTTLTEEHFPDAQYRTLFLLMERYLETTGGVLTKAALDDILTSKNVDSGRKSLYIETYDALSKGKHDDAEFRWSIEQLKELAAERKTAEAITTGMEILNRGAKGPKNEDLFGHSDARAHILERFAEVDRELTMQQSPEGDARTEADEIWEEINNPETLNGIKFGIPTLDNVTGGAQRGELVLVGGYTNSGKSMLASAQLPWSAAIEQGKNVIILTTETLRPQIRRRLISRHSRHTMFGLEKGINSRDLKRGREFLPPDQLAVLPDIIDDFTKNPNYGKLVIVQIPRNATITSCENRALRYQREFQVDLIVIDSINLLRADRRFQSKREELASMLIEAKQFATTFADGQGVPVVSPWQVNRDSWKEAQEKGYYNTSGLSETHEASSSSDLILTILEPSNNNKREAEIKMQVAKARDGETSDPFDVNVDYGTGYWSAASNSGNELDGLFGGSGGTSLFDM
jgi:replicative DNA helicase